MYIVYNVAFFANNYCMCGLFLMLGDYKTAKKRHLFETPSTHTSLQGSLVIPRILVLIQRLQSDRTLLCCGQLREQEVQYFFFIFAWPYF